MGQSPGRLFTIGGFTPGGPCCATATAAATWSFGAPRRSWIGRRTVPWKRGCRGALQVAVFFLFLFFFFCWVSLYDYRFIIVRFLVLVLAWCWVALEMEDQR